MRDGVVLRLHMPGLEAIDVVRCLPLHQRRQSFRGRRHQQRRFFRPPSCVGFRKTQDLGRCFLVFLLFWVREVYCKLRAEKEMERATQETGSGIGV